MTNPTASIASPTGADTPEKAPNIGVEMAKGTGWMVAARLGVQGIGFLSTIILARLLIPADFGLVALANTFSAALQAVTEFSFEVVLIQNQEADRSHYDTAWTLSMIRNVILAAFLVAVAGLVADAFGDRRLEAVTCWLALGTFLEGFQNIGIVEFRKNLAFHKDLVFTVLGKLGSFIVTVPLAFFWRNYWPLVAGIVVGTVLRVILSYVMHGYRPRLSLSRWRELMHFSKWLVLSNVFGFLFTRSDTFVLGKFASAQALGVYGVAFDIANMTTSNFIAPLRRATFPGYAKLSGDMEGLRTGFIGVVALAMLIGAPMAVGIGVIADPLVRVLLGNAWIECVPLIQILSIYGLLSLVSSGSGPIFLATGRPKYILFILAASSVVIIPLLLIGVKYLGALGVACAVTIAMAVLVTTDFVLISRLLKLPLFQIVVVGYRPVIASAAMVLAVLEIQALWPAPTSALEWSILLVASVVVGAVVHISVAVIAWALAGWPDGAERHVIKAVRAVLPGAIKRRFAN